MRESARERVKGNIPADQAAQARRGGYEPTPTGLAAVPATDDCDRRCPQCGAPIVVRIEKPPGPPVAMPANRETTALVARNPRLGKKPDQRDVETRPHRRD